MTIEKEKEIAKKLKEEYGEKDNSKISEVVALDKKVHRSAEIFAYTFGVLGSLVLGVGMCLAMKIIFDLVALGIVVGCLGIFMVSINYPIYKSIIKRNKAKYGKKIIALSNEILSK